MQNRCMRRHTCVARTQNEIVRKETMRFNRNLYSAAFCGMAFIAIACIPQQALAQAWPNPPSNAYRYALLQKGTEWLLTDGAATGSLGNSTQSVTQCGGSDSLTQGVSSPSQSGSALEVTDDRGSCNEWNVLAHMNLCSSSYVYPNSPSYPGCLNVTHMEYEVSFYVDAATNWQALEFDPDLTTGGYTYWASVECDTGSGDWKYFDSNAHHWTEFPTSHHCGLLDSSNHWITNWYRLRLYVTYNTSTHQYQYQGLTLDTYQGSTVQAGTPLFSSSQGNINACNGSTDAKCQNWANRLWVEDQVDNNYKKTDQVAHMYYDYYNLTVW